jgi:hypothetical protein
MSYISPYISYDTDGVTVEYAFNFEALLVSDVAVYLTASGQDFNPTDDLVSPDDYSLVLAVSSAIGGTLTMTAIPAAGGTLVIANEADVVIETSFSDVETFTPGNVDKAFHRAQLLLQQNNFLSNYRALHYPISYGNLLQDATEVAPLKDGEYWKRVGDSIIGVTPVPGDEDTLRSELASQVENGDGAGLIGFYNTEDSGGETVAQTLQVLVERVAELWNSTPQPGEIAFGYFTVAKPTWVLLDHDGTFGNAASLATLLASETTLPLYTYLYDTFTDAQCPVVGGRTTDAATDFAAGAAIRIPRIVGRDLSIAGIATLDEIVTADFTTDELTIADSSLYWIGTKVQLTTAGTLPAGLALGTDYHIIKVTGTKIKLADTPQDAFAGTAVVFTTNGTGALTLAAVFNNRPVGDFSGFPETTQGTVTGAAGAVQNGAFGGSFPIVGPTAFFNAQIKL